MKRLLAVALMIAHLIGCATPYPAEVERVDAALCQSRGAMPGTSAYNNCMAQLYAVCDSPQRERNKVLEALLIGAVVVGGATVVANNPGLIYPPPIYTGNCPTPDSLDSRGYRCGRRAASYRPGG